MKRRTLLSQATPALKRGDEVLTPSGRVATVEDVDRARGEVLVRWPAEVAAFRPTHLRRADTREGGGIVFLELGGREDGEVGEA